MVLFFFLPELQFCCSGERASSRLSLSMSFSLLPFSPGPASERRIEIRGEGAKKGRRRRNGSVFLTLPFSPEQKSEGGGDQEWRKAPKPANQP